MLSGIVSGTILGTVSGTVVSGTIVSGTVSFSLFSFPENKKYFTLGSCALQFLMLSPLGQFLLTHPHQKPRHTASFPPNRPWEDVALCGLSQRWWALGQDSHPKVFITMEEVRPWVNSGFPGQWTQRTVHESSGTLGIEMWIPRILRHQAQYLTKGRLWAS